MRTYDDYVAAIKAVRFDESANGDPIVHFIPLNPETKTMPLYDHEALHEDMREADPRAGEREALKFECMKLASILPDSHSTKDLIKNGNAIFDAVTGGVVRVEGATDLQVKL